MNLIKFIYFREHIGKLNINLKTTIIYLLILRTGWVLRDVKESESIADHMYRMAVMSFLAPKNLDKNK